MIRFVAAYVLLALATGPFAQTRAIKGPNPSKSKISLHLLGGRYTAGAKLVVAERPRVLKLFDLGKDMRDALLDYKTKCPDGVVVLRLWTPVRYLSTANPEASAEHYWSTWIWPQLALVTQAERDMIDYVEGPNEGDSTPIWGSLADAQWFNRFWVRLVALYQTQGIRPCVGSIPVGNPPGTPTEMRDRFLAFAPAMEAALAAKGAWSYHAYTIGYTQNVAEEIWFSLRYRQLYSILRQNRSSLTRLPLILTEGGVDESGNPLTSGWQARGTAEKYQQWLTWFDSELKKDPYVIGVTLFQSGDPTGWPSFETEPITGWLANYLRANR